jgi:hypothetical protein
MSTRDDASLTARERAALASLEALAAAEDPQLAHRLRGSGRIHLSWRVPRVPDRFRTAWWGGPVVLVGLALMVLSLGTTLVLGVAGAGLATFGLWLVVVAIAPAWFLGASRTDGPGGV